MYRKAIQKDVRLLIGALALGNVTKRSFRNDVAIADAVCALSTEKFSLKFDLSSSNEISMENVRSSGKHRCTVALRECLGYQTSIRAAMDPIRKSLREDRPFEYSHFSSECMRTPKVAQFKHTRRICKGT